MNTGRRAGVIERHDRRSATRGVVITGQVTATASGPEFDAWLSRMERDPGLGTDLSDAGAEVREWLAAVVRDNGELSAPWLDRLVFDRRRQLAEATVRELSRAAAAEVGPVGNLRVRITEPDAREPAGSVEVGVETIRSLDRAGIVTEAADGVQGYIARERNVSWPVCPAHGRGLHPAARAGAAEWICSAGGHAVAPILSE